MNWALSVMTAPTEEPVTATEAIEHLREDETIAQLNIINGLIRGAREHAEHYTRRAFVTQTLKYRIPDFQDIIKLPSPPLASVTHIKYTDLSGAEQTLGGAIYDVDTDSEPGVITRGWQKVWPSVRDVQLPVAITYDAGYGAASAVPQAIKQAMLLLIGHWYENRIAVSTGNSVNEYPKAVDALLWPYRILTV